MRSYNLSFIRDEDLFDHVKNTVLLYQAKIDFKQFTKNILDPIKMSFDSLIYNFSIEKLIDSEVLRQIDKSNNNHIGYFHQNIFKYIGGDDWVIPKKGFDLINESESIFIEIKNKHNTMNSSSSQKTYMRMLDKIASNEKATCYLLEIIAKKSQDIPWEISLDYSKIVKPNIRRISVDQFYFRVTKQKDSFFKLCMILPQVIRDVLATLKTKIIDNTVLEEFYNISLKGNKKDYLEFIYYLAFKHYEGF